MLDDPRMCSLFLMDGLQIFQASVVSGFVSRRALSTNFGSPCLLAVPGSQESKGYSRSGGVRGAKFAESDSEEPDYTFTMDRPSARDVFLDLRFPVDQEYTRDLPRHVLARARKIARTLVRPVKNRS